ncbi:AAA family ATPase [Terrimonas ferruginea]|uniref:AAA family ATPase n=1 Tax=Terrimonas ferruginea TaxID=249 RepID=UPI000405E89D|nr:AAA family ATPase [Terrimonas ferruginea]
MKINSFKAGKVHGYLNYDIDFFPDLTFLIGINGSGKTSALKLILGLISPSYHYLNQIDYTFAELICSSKDNEKDIVIRAEQSIDQDVFTLRLKSHAGDFEPVVFPRFVRPEDENYDIEEISLREQSLKELFDLSELTKIIREIATPKFLGLDRKIYEGKAIDRRFKHRRMYGYPKKRKYYEGSPGASAIDSSLEDVQFLIFEYFRIIAYQQPKISEEFKRKIFQLSFNFIDDYNLEQIPETDSVIADKKEKVLKAIKNLDIAYLDYNVNSFFQQMQRIVEQNNEYKEKNETTKGISDDQFKVLRKWFNNSSQLRRIDEIINFSQTYQEKIAELRAPIKRLENITSNFLKEGKKQIQIAEDGEIKVKLSNGKLASVFELSSGEKQIIIMIAHLIFEEDQKPSGVFIIDEPELSLHIAWQEIFVNSITEASPKTQFILATHSPSIISKVKREQYCQDLNKLNY